MRERSRLTPFRRELFRLIPASGEHLASHPSTAFIWPTENCSIGCAHCNFSSVPRRPGPPSDLCLNPVSLLEWLRDARVRTMVLCGGGEPLDEPEFCREVIHRCSRTPMNFGIYTSGASLAAPCQPREYVRDWHRLTKGDHQGAFWIRLSVDAFHTQRLGTDVLAQWITAVEEIAPAWKLTLRGLRVAGDRSLRELAGRLGAGLHDHSRSSMRLVLPSGRRIVVERMAFVVDGRGTPEVLTRHGLSLPAEDAAELAPWQALVGRPGQLGRPLSRRLTVGRHHVDLEIHADARVHVLEAQAFDNRLSLNSLTWLQMRETYYRDPLIHAVAVGGLPLAAELISAAIKHGVAPRDTVPFSIERIEDARLLDWVTAAATLRLQDEFRYPEAALALARNVLEAQVAGMRG